MPFDKPLCTKTSKRKTAIIGGGISGMGASLALAGSRDVTLFEARKRLGGHARTLMAGPNADIPVDTGFMVFNHQNYPHLIGLFDQLDIPVKPSNMTFAVSLDDGKFEYGLQNLRRILGDPKNAVNPRFWRMLRDIIKFNNHARETVSGPDQTLGELIQDLNLSEAFTRRYICPLAGAIWSTSSDDILNFPAETLLRFFENHGLLSASDGPKWYTPHGGSKIYVERLERVLNDQGCDIRKNAPVKEVRRENGHVMIRAYGAEPETFDEVIFACHSDQAIRMLSDPTPEEIATIGQIRYRPNEVILHSDARQMPVRRNCWSSWIYKGRSDDHANNAFTYWMNLLQDIPQDTPLFVTLNPQTPIAEDKIYNTTTLSHPQFDLPALTAQRKIRDIQGLNQTWYCGAYCGYGFHEDGLSSGYEAARLVRKRTLRDVA